jgi:hypothetical protein
MHVTKMLTSAIEDQVRVTMICGTMLSVDTTYPLCGWVWFGASKRCTKLIGGSSIGARGGTDLTFPEMQERLHNPRATSRGRMHSRPGKAGRCRGS